MVESTLLYRVLTQQDELPFSVVDESFAALEFHVGKGRFVCIEPIVPNSMIHRLICNPHQALQALLRVSNPKLTSQGVTISAINRPQPCLLPQRLSIRMIMPFLRRCSAMCLRVQVRKRGMAITTSRNEFSYPAHRSANVLPRTGDLQGRRGCTHSYLPHHSVKAQKTQRRVHTDRHPFPTILSFFPPPES